MFLAADIMHARTHACILVKVDDNALIFLNICSCHISGPAPLCVLRHYWSRISEQRHGWNRDGILHAGIILLIISIPLLPLSFAVSFIHLISCTPSSMLGKWVVWRVHRYLCLTSTTAFWRCTTTLPTHLALILATFLL